MALVLLQVLLMINKRIGGEEREGGKGKGKRDLWATFSENDAIQTFFCPYKKKNNFGLNLL